MDEGVSSSDFVMEFEGSKSYPRSQYHRGFGANSNS
jgi:hypothetical protein